MSICRKLAAPLFAIFVFLMGMVFLFTNHKGTIDGGMYLICGLYGVICLLFLLFQLYAFFKAHTEYDEDVEKIKYQVFAAEGMDYEEEEIL